jgi:UDPglucose 6-dehydrogenase
MVSNPEFLREGSAVGDFMRPDRVVVGAETDRAREIMEQVYRPLYLLETPIVSTSLESAEMIKYASNAFLATKISFINEVANLCERIGGDVNAVARGIGLDGRIGKKFLHAGPGFGGSCFPKDTRSAAYFAREIGEEFQVVEAVIRVNDKQRERMVEKIRKAVGGDLSGKTIAVLGLSFKPETDDMRDAPAVDIIAGLQKGGAQVRAFDPVAMEAASRVLRDVRFCGDAYEACEGADAVVIVTEWNQFRMLELERVRALVARPVLVDLRNVYEPGPMAKAGFEYHSVGR